MTSDPTTSGGHSCPGMLLERVVVGRGAARVGPIDVEIAAGELVALQGPNGSGKSTLLLSLAGLHGIESGRVRIGERVLSCRGMNGKEVQLEPRLRQCGVLLQGLGLWPHLTVAQQCRMMACSSAFEEWSELLGLDALWDRKPQQLSGGEAQRVALLRTLLADATWYLLDEPHSAQHDEGIERVNVVIEQLRQRGAIVWVAGAQHIEPDHRIRL